MVPSPVAVKLHLIQMPLDIYTVKRFLETSVKLSMRNNIYVFRFTTDVSDGAILSLSVCYKLLIVHIYWTLTTNVVKIASETLSIEVKSE